MKKTEKKIFFMKFIKNPKSIGSIYPSSLQLAQKINQIIDKLEKVNILEIGPGTGAITRQILEKNPTLIEIDSDLCEILKEKFTDLKIINSCALKELNQINHEVGIVLTMPLINNPNKEILLKILSQKYLEKKIKWCVVYTYGYTNPLSGTCFINQRKEKFCLFNLPPANIWVYT